VTRNNFLFEIRK